MRMQAHDDWVTGKVQATYGNIFANEDDYYTTVMDVVYATWQKDTGSNV